MLPEIQVNPRLKQLKGPSLNTYLFCHHISMRKLQMSGLVNIKFILKLYLHPMVQNATPRLGVSILFISNQFQFEPC